MAGTTLADPARIDIRGTLTCGRDVRIDVGCMFEGDVALADGVDVGPYCVLRDVAVGAGTAIAAFSHLETPAIGARCSIGPYARLRPGRTLQDDVHIGNFVEIKASTLGRGTKANHLAYIGNAIVGSGVNYGAGAIVANYDGANKHTTVIGDNVHIGSNCVLIAPVTIGEGATIAGGSTIAQDAPPGQLTVARARQVTVPAGSGRPRSPSPAPKAKAHHVRHRRRGLAQQCRPDPDRGHPAAGISRLRLDGPRGHQRRRRRRRSSGWCRSRASRIWPRRPTRGS